jgi:hypothetical protein
MAASVVDFPDPVGPVTSTRPRDSAARLAIAAGRFSSSMVGMCGGISRKSAAEPRSCLKRFVRKRPSFRIGYAKSTSPVIWYRLQTSGGVIAESML